MGTLRVALFLDRDGVLNEPVWDPQIGNPESPLDPSQVVLTGGAAAAVARAKLAGLAVVVVSNQPAAAKGIVSLAVIGAVHERVLALLTAGGGTVERSYLCLHHPHGLLPDLTVTCECRKPAPGMLRRAAEELQLDLGRSWMIGDTDADLLAARRAGLAGVVIVANPLSAHRRSNTVGPADALTKTLYAAVDFVVRRLPVADTPVAR